MAGFDQMWAGWKAAEGPVPYLLVDAAGLEQGASALPRGLCSEIECLFTGDLALELVDVAPYLGRLASWDQPVREGVEALLRDHVGVLVLPKPGREGEAPGFSELHRHFRKLNVVYGAGGQPLFFRYYDPRVLPDVLSVLDAQQLQAFFGPVDSLVLFNLQGRPLQCYPESGRIALQE